MSFHLSSIGGTGSQCVSGLGDHTNFPQNRADFLKPDSSFGYQVIIPQFRFNCFGMIRDWSALTVYPITKYEPSRVAIFQVWRPTGLGRYALVGYESIFAVRDNLTSSSNGSSPRKGVNFYTICSADEKYPKNITESKLEGKNPLYFQPGDIVGFYVRNAFTSIPLIVTHHNSTNEDPKRLIVDMFYIKTLAHYEQHQVCQMSECGKDVNRINSVIPHLFFTYS